MEDELGKRKRIAKQSETPLRNRDDDFRRRGDITRTVRAVSGFVWELGLMSCDTKYI